MKDYLNIIKLIIGNYLFYVILLFSCSKERNSPDSVKGTTVTFSVNDITYPTKSNVINKATSIENNIETKKKIKEYDSFSMELSTNSDPINNNTFTNVQNEITLKANKSTNIAKTPMAIGIKYRLLIYSVDDGIETYFTTSEVTVGTSDFKITLSPGKTYNWYAYSYNNSNAIPLPIDLNTPFIPSQTENPLLYTKGTITLGDTEQRVSMTFQHKVAKIEVIVNGQYIFANDIPVLNVDFNDLTLTTHNFDLKTGDKTGNILTSQIIPNQPIDFESINGIALYGIKRSNNDLYTSSLNPTLNISLKRIDITKTGTTLTLINTARNESFSNFTGADDLIKRLSIKLVYKGGNLAPNEWAKGNLYYDNTDPDNPYKFGEPVNQSFQHSCNYYWNWNTLLPRTLTNMITSPVGDPCTKVLPIGEWRTPTITDFENLLETHTVYPNVPEQNGGAVYFNAQNGSIVRFHETGTLTLPSCLVMNTNDGQYWSSSERGLTRGFILEIDERGGAGGENIIAHRLKTQGRSIRCVRDI